MMIKRRTTRHHRTSKSKSSPRNYVYAEFSQPDHCRQLTLTVLIITWKPPCRTGSSFVLRHVFSPARFVVLGSKSIGLQQKHRIERLSPCMHRKLQLTTMYVLVYIDSADWSKN